MCAADVLLCYQVSIDSAVQLRLYAIAARQERLAAQIPDCAVLSIAVAIRE